jgi:RNA polymerase sigma-70 factor, ECF subfamily
VATVSETRTINNDESLLIQKAQKDPKDFKALYEKHYKRIFVFVLHRVGDKSLCADITSQVFLKAMLNIGKYKNVGVPFSAWLFRIALNETYDYLRKINRYRCISIDDTAVEKLHEELTADSTLVDLEERLPMILEKLSLEELHLLELRFFEHRPFKEVADILKISENYAKVRVYRLLDKMKQLFITTLEN